jgi:hypothetical protein
MATTTRDIGRFLEARLREKGRDAVLTYGELISHFDDLPEFTGEWFAHPLCNMFGELDIEDAEFNRPFRTAIVVSQRTNFPGDGFFTMYVEHRDPTAQIRNDIDRITIHQGELRELAAHYGHA